MVGSSASADRGRGRRLVSAWPAAAWRRHRGFDRLWRRWRRRRRAAAAAARLAAAGGAAARGRAVGAAAPCGHRAAGGGGLAGRGPPRPGMNEKSSASDDEIHGTCSLREARVTPTRVRLSVSSAIRSGTRISFSSSCTNRLWSPPLSETTERQRRRIHHQRAVRRDHRRKAGGEAAEPALERIAPGGIDQRDLDAGAAVVDFAQHRLEAEAVAADVRLGPDLGIDRDHVALAARTGCRSR